MADQPAQDDPVLKRGAELFGGPVVPVPTDDEHVHTDACRSTAITMGASGGKHISVSLACGQPSPYIGARWPEGINTYQYEQGEEDSTPARVQPREAGVVAFKIQCIDCRQKFGRWWKLKKDAPMPSAEEIRARGRALLEAADFSYENDSWHCPTVTTLAAYRDMLLSEGVIAGALSWEES